MTTPQNEENSSGDALTTTIVSAIAEISGSLLKIAQERIIERVEETANRITHNVVMMLTIVFLGLTGLIFMLIGFSIWLGMVSGFGVWFGLLITGTVILITALIIAVTQKNK